MDRHASVLVVWEGHVMRAAIYARISQDRKDASGDMSMLGVSRQIDDCQGLADTLGWQVVETYVDNDISATTGKPRPSYRRMLDAVRDGTVEAIIAWHPDRLYRRTIDLEELVEVVEKTRAPIATVNAGTVDLTTPSGRLVARLLGATARYEGEHKAERWRRGYRQRREAGEPPRQGPRLYGWTRDGVIVEAERDVILYAAREILSGRTLHAVCRDLQQMGATTTRGNMWKPSALRNLLRNQRLAGWVTIEGERVARSSWTPILTEEQSESIRALTDVRQPRKSQPRVSILLGVIHCGACGAPLIAGRRTSGGTRTYKCPVDMMGVKRTGRGCVEIVADPVEQIVEGFARERLSDPRVRETLTTLRSGDKGAKIAHEIGQHETRLLELQHALDDPDATSVAEITRAMDRVRDKIDDARERLAAAMSSPALPSVDTWPTAPDKRNALIALVVERVEIDPLGPNKGGAFRPERVRIEPR